MKNDNEISDFVYKIVAPKGINRIEQTHVDALLRAIGGDASDDAVLRSVDEVKGFKEMEQFQLWLYQRRFQNHL